MAKRRTKRGTRRRSYARRRHAGEALSKVLIAAISAPWLVFKGLYNFMASMMNATAKSRAKSGIGPQGHLPRKRWKLIR